MKLNLIAFAALPAILFADVPVQEKYPDADAVIVDGIVDISYNADGSSVTEDCTWIKVLTEKGCREESEITLPYNARSCTAEIVSAKVLREDGSEREIDIAATMKDATDNSSAKDNIYDPMHRKITARIPGLKIGDTLFCKTRVDMIHPRVENLFATVHMLEWTCPMERQRVRISAPKDLPLKKIAVKHPLGNVSYTAMPRPDGSILHEWTATNSPQAFAEPNMPPMHTQAQALRVSTAESWEEISRWYWNTCLPHLEKTTPAITNKVEEILSSLPAGASKDDRLYAVYKWVAQEIRYMGLVMEDKSPGYAPHDVSITFSNMYGVCRDKAALLVEMLRIAGFDAYPVLINAGSKMDDEVPLPYFNHAIVAVRDPSDSRATSAGFVLMDPTNESSADLLPSYLDDKSYLVATPEGEPLHVSPIVPAGLNAVKIAASGTLDREGTLSMDTEVSFTGMNDNVYRSTLLRRKTDERRKLFERIVSAVVPGAEMTGFSVSPADLRRTEEPLTVKFSYRTSDALLEGGTRDILDVPFLSRVFGAANWILDGATSLDRRRYPLVVDSTAKSAETVEIRLEDESMTPASLPDPVKTAGAYVFEKSYSFSGSVLRAERSVSVDAVEFSPAEYDMLRDAIKLAETAERDKPVFLSDDASGADVKVLSAKTDVHATSPTSWTVTNSVVKKVLTYDGKKRSAELKYTFNPVWENVEIVSATVTSPDGHVYAASSNEVNRFDCTWAASAPRYPASTQLIVNMPSVEIGSVLSYTVAASATNSPLPFKALWYFDRREPAGTVEYSYTGPSGETWQKRIEQVPLVPQEPMQPDDRLWREHKSIILGGIAERAAYLKQATVVEPVSYAEIEVGPAADESEKIAAVRKWMSRNVRVAGPSLNEIPLPSQTTDPEIVLRERYATRLDYVRTMAALLKGLGLDASVVFAADDAKSNPRLLALLEQTSDGAAFSSALCRVRAKGRWPWSGHKAEYWIGTESEWIEPGSTAWDGCRYLDPESGEIGIVEASVESKTETRYKIELRENGSADIDVEEKYYGAYTDGFRKKYEEMLPEDRSRHFQEVVGELSQNAVATRELETDTSGYPATLSYSVYIPNFATVRDGVMTISVPDIADSGFAMTGLKRKTPIGIPSSDKSSVSSTVVFPEGYSIVEHLPESYCVSDPSGSAEEWSRFSVESKSLPDGRLSVELNRVKSSHRSISIANLYLPLVKEWTRLGRSRSNRTVSARKEKCGFETAR